MKTLQVTNNQIKCRIKSSSDKDLEKLTYNKKPTVVERFKIMEF